MSDDTSVYLLTDAQCDTWTHGHAHTALFTFV